MKFDDQIETPSLNKLIGQLVKFVEFVKFAWPKIVTGRPATWVEGESVRLTSKVNGGS